MPPLPHRPSFSPGAGRRAACSAALCASHESNRAALGAVLVLVAGVAFVVGLPLCEPRSTAMESPIVLKNSAGLEVHILRRGAIIQRLLTPSREPGYLADVVLGFDDEQPYKASAEGYHPRRRSLLHLSLRRREASLA